MVTTAVSGTPATDDGAGRTRTSSASLVPGRRWTRLRSSSISSDSTRTSDRWHLVSWLHGLQLRPTAKISTSRWRSARRQIAAGAIGACCATLAEAEAMVAGGIPGVMLFSPVVSETKLRRLATLSVRAEDLIVATDDVENVAQLGSAARQAGRTLQVLVDLDVGGGRTGVVDHDSAVALARRIEDTDGPQFAGLQAYKGLGSITDFVARREAWLVRASGISKAIARLDAEGLYPRIISGGGTGSHDFEHEAAVLTGDPGGHLCVHGRQLPEQRVAPRRAAPIPTSTDGEDRVISAVQPGFVVTDAGTKEIDSYRGPSLQWYSQPSRAVLATPSSATTWAGSTSSTRLPSSRSGPPSRSCRLSASRLCPSTPFTTAWPGTSSWTFGRSRQFGTGDCAVGRADVPGPANLELLDNLVRTPYFLSGGGSESIPLVTLGGKHGATGHASRTRSA